MSARETFSGGVAVITGAGAGIGAALVRHAVTLGMTAVLADVDAEAIVALRDELRAAGGSAVDVVCDVRDPLAVQDLADRTYRDVGPVRLLVNNAGIEQFGYLWDHAGGQLAARRRHQRQRSLPRRARVSAEDDGHR